MSMRYPAGTFHEPATPYLVIGMLDSPPVWSRFDLGVGRFSGRWRPGDFIVSPSNGLVEHEADAERDCLMFVVPLSFARDAFCGLAGSALEDYGPLHGSGQRDAQIESLVRRLWVEAGDNNPMGSLFADDVSAAIASRLTRLTLRASGMTGLERQDDTPPLHGRRLTRVLELIEDELAEGLRQTDLATAADLSPWYFCRAFKAATGVAPHRFVLLKRLALAQRFLKTDTIGLAEIAIATGFGSHSHLTKAFKQQVGLTPSAWREANRSSY